MTDKFYTAPCAGCNEVISEHDDPEAFADYPALVLCCYCREQAKDAIRSNLLESDEG